MPYDLQRPAVRRGVRRLATIAAAALAVGCVASGCAGDHRGRGAAQPTVPSTLAATRTIRIGFLGDRGAEDKAVERGERLAVSQFGSAGGVQVAEVDVSTGGTEAGAASGARTLVADHVVAAIGPESAVEVEGAAPVLAAAGIPSVTVTATEPDLTARGWPGFFRAVADIDQQGALLVDDMVKALGGSRVGVVADRSPADDELAGAAASEVANDNATVALDQPALTAEGVAALASQVVANDVDALVCAVPPALAGDLIMALTADRYAGRLVLAGQTPAQDMAGAVGGSTLRVLVASPADDPSSAVASTSAAVFVDAYRAAYGDQPPPWAAEAYDATRFVLAAVSAGSVDGAGVRQYLAGGSLNGVTALVAFDSAGDEQYPPEFVSRVESGALVQTGTAGP